MIKRNSSGIVQISNLLRINFEYSNQSWRDLLILKFAKLLFPISKNTDRLNYAVIASRRRAGVFNTAHNLGRSPWDIMQEYYRYWCGSSQMQSFITGYFHFHSSATAAFHQLEVLEFFSSKRFLGSQYNVGYSFIYCTYYHYY